MTHPLSHAVGHLSAVKRFRPNERAHWFVLRKGVEEFLKYEPNDEHIALREAYNAVADWPERLADEASAWEELRHQAEVVISG